MYDNIVLLFLVIGYPIAYALWFSLSLSQYLAAYWKRAKLRRQEEKESQRTIHIWGSVQRSHEENNANILRDAKYHICRGGAYITIQEFGALTYPERLKVARSIMGKQLKSDLVKVEWGPILPPRGPADPAYARGGDNNNGNNRKSIIESVFENPLVRDEAYLKVISTVEKMNDTMDKMERKLGD